MGVGGTAFAGEIGGNGEPTPIDSYRAGSICSFSGLNDEPTSPDPFEDGRVQNWGTVLGDAKVFLGDGKGASAISHEILVEGPGTNCRGYASQGG
jgi:hypothetical protein